MIEHVENMDCDIQLNVTDEMSQMCLKGVTEETIEVKGGSVSPKKRQKYRMPLLVR